MKKYWLFALVLCLFTIGCTRNTTTLKAADNGKTIRVKPGQVIAISLESNPTTGYNWYVVGELPAMLEQQGEPAFKAAPGSAGRVGAGGTTTLRFKVVEAGPGELTLGYMRSWEDQAPAETFTVTIAAAAD